MCKNTSMFKEIVIHEDVMQYIIKVFLWKSTVNRSRTQQPCLCQEMAFYKTPPGGHVVFFILPKMNRLCSDSSIHNCTNFENNQSKETGVRASAS